MPTTVTGALLFVIGLFPGYIYTVRAERRRAPVRAYSALREVVTVVFASAVSLLLALGVFAIARVLIARHAPDVGAVVRDGHSYFVGTYQYLFGWIGILFFTACAIALAIASVPVPAWLAKSLLGAEGVAFEGSWWTIFEFPEAADRDKVVTCRLSDGSAIEGALYTYSPDLDPAGRELTLSAPITFTDTHGSVDYVIKGVMTVRAANIVHLQVRYVTDDDYARETSAVTGGSLAPGRPLPEGDRL